MKSRKTDAERREKQANRLVRILTVHRLSNGCKDTTSYQTKAIADSLGVAERTVYRDYGVLRKLYETLGTTKLDIA